MHSCLVLLCFPPSPSFSHPSADIILVYFTVEWFCLCTETSRLSLLLKTQKCGQDGTTEQDTQTSAQGVCLSYSSECTVLGPFVFLSRSCTNQTKLAHHRAVSLDLRFLYFYLPFFVHGKADDKSCIFSPFFFFKHSRILGGGCMFFGVRCQVFFFFFFSLWYWPDSSLNKHWHLVSTVYTKLILSSSELGCRFGLVN